METNKQEKLLAMLLAEVSTFSNHVKPVAIGRALARLGFERGRQGNSRGYYVVVIPPDERKRLAISRAVAAMSRRRKAIQSPIPPDEPALF